MKCPKCHYLSFDPEPRCRNCGYDLELSDDLDLKTAEGEVEGPLADLALRDTSERRRAPLTLELVHPSRVAPGANDQSPPAAGDGRAAVAAAAAVDDPPPSLPPAAAAAAAPSLPAAAAPARPDAAPAARRPAQRPPSTTSELPLFVKAVPDDRASAAAGDGPLVSVPAVPRAPLSVRRGSPELSRPRPRGSVAEDRKLGPLDHDLLEDLQRVEREEALVQLTARTIARPSPAPPQEAAMSTRVAAAALDGLLLGAIGGVVLFATLRLCGLGVDQIEALPLMPMAAFLLIVSVGYLLMFTIAGGQTIGKMAMGIRVIGMGPVLSVRQAAYRELLSLPLVGALGAGYMPAVLGRGPAVHDRLAETRVVRA